MGYPLVTSTFGIFDAILKFVAIVLAIIMVVYLIVAILVHLGVSATVFQIMAFGSTTWSAGTFLVVAILSGIVSVWVSPDGFKEVIDPLLDAVSVIVATGVSVLADVTSTAVDAVVNSVVSASSSPILVLAIGAGVFFMLKSKKPNLDNNKLENENGS